MSLFDPNTSFTPLDSDSENVWAESNDTSFPSQNQSSSSANISRQNSLLRRRQPRDAANDLDVHPLTTEDDVDVSDDISRPALMRLTSEVERQVAESSRSGGASLDGGSNRGSLDLLRMSGTEGGGEVEVILHLVKPSESLAGIALLYGIDLATLRKINKLWPSDPVHLRTRLYIPLEACRWNKASETLQRGPGEGQVTLISKHQGSGSRKGKEKEKATEDIPRSRSISGSSTILADHERLAPEDVTVGPEDSYSELLDQSYRNTSPVEDDIPTPRVLDVVRIPNSQLRFFPKSQQSTSSPRTSLDRDRRRISSPARPPTTGPSIQNDLSTLPKPLKSSTPDPEIPPPLPKPKSSTIVRLRPPTSIKPNPTNNNLANRLSSLFVVPPPPIQPAWGSVPAVPRRSMESSVSASSPRVSRRSSIASNTTMQPEVLLEMHPRSPDLVRMDSNGYTTRRLSHAAERKKSK